MSIEEAIDRAPSKLKQDLETIFRVGGRPGAIVINSSYHIVVVICSNTCGSMMLKV